jgi:ABC-type Fe3+/spermidine/putrescine transport system ATPase subunit
MLELQELRKSWPDFGLDVSLSLSRGEIAAILGPSGSGKSTLLRLIAGLERPDSGRVLVEGRELSSLPPEKRGVGLVFQDFALFPQMSVRRNIEYGPRMRGQGRRERAKKAVLVAQAFEIEGLLDRSPRSLSGGEQQRVALARAIAADPGIILLDEPLSSLDAALRKRLRSELGSSLRKAGATALLVTHDAQEAFAVADRIFVMGSGRIVESGRPADIYERPETAFTARLLGEGPVFPCTITGEEGGRLIASSAIGSFLCLPPRGGHALRDRYSIFFPAEAAVPEEYAEGRPRGRGYGRFGGKLVSLSYEGRCLGAVVECEDEAGEKLRVELKLPLGSASQAGRFIAFRVPEGRAVLVSEDR